MMRLTGFSYVGRIENLRDLVYYKLYGKDNFWFPFEVSDMVKNNIELDVKTKCIEQGPGKSGRGDRNHEGLCESCDQEAGWCGESDLC